MEKNFDSVEFGQFLRKCRIDSGISIYDLAIAVDIRYEYLSEVENGRQIPSITLAVSLLEQLGKTFNDFYNMNISTDKVEVLKNVLSSKLADLNENEILFLTESAKLK